MSEAYQIPEMSTMENINSPTPPLSNLMNNQSNSFRETIIVTSVALAVLIVALVVFLGTLLLWKVRCKRCSNTQSEENPQHSGEVYMNDFVPDVFSEDDAVPRYSSYASTTDKCGNTSQINCNMATSFSESNSSPGNRHQSNDVTDNSNDNNIYQEFESEGIDSVAGSSSFYPKRVSLDISPESATLHLYPEAEAHNVYTEFASHNVYNEAEPPNVYSEAEPPNVYSETDSPNVYTDFQLNSFQEEKEHSSTTPYQNIGSPYSEARTINSEDANSQVTCDSNTSDDSGSLYLNSNEINKSSSRVSSPSPESVNDFEDPINSVYDSPPNNSLFRSPEQDMVKTVDISASEA